MDITREKIQAAMKQLGTGATVLLVARQLSGSENPPASMVSKVKAHFANAGKPENAWMEKREDGLWYLNEEPAPIPPASRQSGGAVYGLTASPKPTRVAEAFEDRPAVTLTVYQECRYPEVINLEYFYANGGWKEQPAWVNIKLYLSPELEKHHPQQTKARDVLKVRITTRSEKGPVQEELNVPANHWVILTPA